MLNINPWNIAWTVVNLLVLYLIFKSFLFDKVMGVIQAREAMVKEQFDSAKKSEEDAIQMKMEYQEQLKNARTEADQIILEARTRAEDEHNRTLEATRMETEHMLEKAKADMALEQEKALKNTQSEIAKLAVIAARKIMKIGDVHDTGSGK